MGDELARQRREVVFEKLGPLAPRRERGYRSDACRVRGRNLHRSSRVAEFVVPGSHVTTHAMKAMG